MLAGHLPRIAPRFMSLTSPLVRPLGHRSRLGLSVDSTFRLSECLTSLADETTPTMPYADFCSAVRVPPGSLSRRNDTEHISPGKLSHLPCTVAELMFRTIDGYGLRGKLPLVRHAAHIGFVHRLRFVSCFLHFAPAIALELSLTPSPPSGWAEDFHLQAAEHAQHTTMLAQASPPL